MTSSTRNVIVGLTAIVGLVGLGYMIWRFEEIPASMTAVYPVRVHLDDANGLAPGSRVRLSGVDIGQVDTVQLKDDPTQGIEVVCLIRQEFRIPAHWQVAAEIGAFGGGAVLSIASPPGRKPEDAEPAQFLPTDGTAEIDGKASSFMRRLEARLDARLDNVQQGLHDRLSDVGEATERIKGLADEYRGLGERLNELLAKRSVEQVDAGQAEPNVSTIIARTDKRLKDLEAVLADIRDATGRVQTLTDTSRHSVEKLTQRFVAVADDVSDTLAKANALLDEARAGGGTMGKLVQDPALYDALTDTAHRLTDAVRQFQLLIEKWKAEGLPIQY